MEKFVLEPMLKDLEIYSVVELQLYLDLLDELNRNTYRPGCEEGVMFEHDLIANPFVAYDIMCMARHAKSDEEKTFNNVMLMANIYYGNVPEGRRSYKHYVKMPYLSFMREEVNELVIPAIKEQLRKLRDEAD